MYFSNQDENENLFTDCEKAQAMLSGWGLRIDDSTVSLTGRVLDPENIIFRDNETHRGTIQADWGAATSRNKVLVAVSRKEDSCIIYCINVVVCLFQNDICTVIISKVQYQTPCGKTKVPKYGYY